MKLENVYPNHPEKKAGEHFVGNVYDVRGEFQRRYGMYPTARLGGVAYDIDGEVVTDCPELRPLFIGKSDMRRYDRDRTDHTAAIRAGQWRAR